MPPVIVRGSATYLDTIVAQGTTIRALINGLPVSSVSVATKGKFDMKVNAEPGDTIEFMIDLVDANETCYVQDYGQHCSLMLSSGVDIPLPIPTPVLSCTNESLPHVVDKQGSVVQATCTCVNGKWKQCTAGELILGY